MRPVMLALLLCGCASATTTTEDAARAPTILNAGAASMTGEKAQSAAMTVHARPDAVWVALGKAYAEFEIPVTLSNRSSHQIGNASFFKTRRLGGVAMETLMDCGVGMGGQKAASYRIYMSMISDVDANKTGGTDVHTIIVPVGQDMSGGAGDRISCRSNGKFEQMLHTRVQKILGLDGTG